LVWSKLRESDIEKRPLSINKFGNPFSNSKFEKSGGISGGQRVKWLKHKIKKVLPAIKDKIGRAC
jgi:hypothetical protein